METLIKQNNLIKYLIKCNPDKEYTLEFEVWKVNYWSECNEPLEEGREMFMRGSIKWDGRCHIHFGDEDNYLHLEGYEDIKEIKKVIDTVWRKAEKEITCFEKGLAY